MPIDVEALGRAWRADLMIEVLAKAAEETE